jgi:C4-dicarboxylate-specific signal transduction histidine kinase
VIASFLQAGRAKVLAATGCLIVIIAVADWYVGNKASLGVFYILPMMLGGIVLSPVEVAVLALVCSLLRSWFDIPSPQIEKLLRFIFAALAYACSGLFVIALIRNRRLAVEHLARVREEQTLRREAEEQLKILVESSPAAILTISTSGEVIAANHAADRLFLIPAGQTLRGRRIGNYLPVLADALCVENGFEPFRTAAQSQSRRDNGEIFLAHTWFSSYGSPEGRRLAAIVVDASEEMRDREEQSLRQLFKGNRIAQAAVSHEVRNLCGAISVICSNLRARPGADRDEDVQGLARLAGGLEKIASVELQSAVQERLEEVPLQAVLDDLRIVVEPDWREMDGEIHWHLPRPVPAVLAERHGLLQAFLNLVQNSYRAVQESTARELAITVQADDRKATIRFQDTGPGIAVPQRLFEPFQRGADGSGLGLYVSRAMVRSYGGDLRFEPGSAGACFVVELQVVI